MEQKLEQDVLQKLKQRRLKRFWSRVVNMMMCIVVFCTTYALILPAITKETETFCGFEAHVHTIECFPEQEELICEFAEVEIHTHTEECHPTTEELPSCGLEEAEPHTHTDECISPEEKTLSCTLTETEGHTHIEECQYSEEKTLNCTLEETEGHAHIEECQRTEEKTLVCTLAESEGHTHSDGCQRSEEKTLVCTQAESEGHTHSDGCQRSEEKTLVCTLAETAGHTHTAECSVTETQLICGLEESGEHIHEGGCYTEVTSNVCGMAEAAAHAHGDACYTVSVSYGCGLRESSSHAHADVCYTTNVSYGCGQEETEAHIHSDECYNINVSYGCGQEEKEAHLHTDECYTVEGIYGCGMEEEEPHVHGDECYEIDYICELEETEGHAHSEECYVTLYDCGLDDLVHEHTEECYLLTSALICTLEENEEHTHVLECFEGEPACELEEHEHTLICYSDTQADVESAAVWEATLPGRTGDAATDLLAVARSQLGYTESTRNYIVDDAGNVKGYTRYGEWYGSPYGDWCAMFTSFCLHYAGVSDFPQDANCASWVSRLSGQDRFGIPSEYIPEAGDLIFFSVNGGTDHVGIVESVSGTSIGTIEGNSNNQVERKSYSIFDGRIVGYGILTKPQPPVQEDAGHIGPGDAIAWATLVDPIVQLEQTGYGLRQAVGILYSARAGGTLDLKPYIINVNMYDDKGNLIPNGSQVTEGDVIEFRIQYTITGQQLGVMNGQNLTVNADTLTYSLPANFKIVRNDSGNIINSYGEKVGTYVIDSATGKITMTFLDDFIKQNANGVQINGYISFFSTVTKITENENEEQDYHFKDGITLGVTIQEKQEAVGDLTIEKKAAKIVGEEIEYEIIVRSGEGTKGPITITDTMATGLTFKEGISVRKNGSTAVDADFEAAADRQSFTMTLPEMAAGESYTIRYKCEADIALLGAELTARNTASVTGKDSQDHDLEDEVTVDHVFEMLDKTGVDNGDGTITWTITINQAQADISGWVLEDFIGHGNNTVQYTGTVTIKDSSGNVIGTDIVLPYTFPNGSNDTYTVTYTTAHDLADGDTIYNKAVLSYEDTEVNDFAGVGIIGNPFTKTGRIGEVVQDADGNYLLPITWTVTIDTTSAAIPGNSYFMDILEGMVNSHAEDMYMTYGQLMSALASFEAETKRITGEEVEGFSAWTYIPGNDTGKAYNIIQLWNNEDNCQSAKFDRFAVTLGPAGIPKGNVLTFSYEAYGVFPNGVVSTETFVNRFSLQGQYEVEVPVDYVTGSLKATKYAFKAFDPYAEGNPEWKWGDIDWGSVEGTSRLNYEDLYNSYLSWAIELSVPPGYSSTDDIIIYEDLPAGVSVKRVELPFQDNVPTSTFLQLSNMAPGNTYSWDFTLYPANQYGQWQPQGAESVSITVHVTNAGDLEIRIPGKVLKVMGEYAALHGMEELYGYLYIYTQINEDFAWTPDGEGSFVYVNNFKNNFTIMDENGRIIDIGSQTQVIRKDESSGVVRKKAAVDENNIVNYSVVLNAYGKDLIENAAYLHIEDELTYTSPNDKPVRMRLVPGSVKLYEISLASDGGYTKLRQLAANYSYDEINTEKTNSTDWRHIIELDVPDSTTLLLEYSYQVSGTENETLKAVNTCTISGVAEGGISGDNELEIEVKKSSAQADAEGVMIRKVDSSNYGMFLENARFNIYIWNEEQGKYIIVHHLVTGETDFVTDSAGRIVLDKTTMGNDFAYNTAYYIVEKESPSGYFLSPEPYYFQVAHADTVNFPSCLPAGFTGQKLVSGDIIYRENVSNVTEISVEKYWLDYGGNPVTVTGEEVTEVTLELWQMIEGDPASAKLYDTYQLTPDEDGNWSMTIRNLPKSVKPEGASELSNYLYYFKEVAVNGYSLESSENNEGINSGLIKLYNRAQEGYELPETGGSGTILYTMAGLLLMMSSAAYLMYRPKARRREEC